MGVECAKPVGLWLGVGTALLASVSALAAGLGERRPGSLPWLAVLVAVAVAYVLAYGHGIRRVRPRRPAGPSRGARARAGPPPAPRVSSRRAEAGDRARTALLSLCLLHLLVLFLSGAVMLAGQLGLLPAGEFAAKARDAAHLALLLALWTGWVWPCFLAFFCERCGLLILVGMAGAGVGGWMLDAAFRALLRAVYGGAGP